MGLIPGGKRRKEQAKLAKAERKLVELQTAQIREEAADGKPWYMQPTTGAAIRSAIRNRA